MYEYILFEVDHGIATLTLNRPQRLNALTTSMSQEILAAIKNLCLHFHHVSVPTSLTSGYFLFPVFFAS